MHAPHPHPRPLTRRVAPLLLTLVAACQSAPAPVTAPPPQQSEAAITGEAPASPASPTPLSQDAFVKKMSERDTFIALFTHPSCHITPRLKAGIEALPPRDWRDVHYLESSKEAFSQELMRGYLPHVQGWPILFAVRDGQVVDFILGPNNIDVVTHFVDRNLRGVAPPLTPLSEVLEGRDPATFLKNANINIPLDFQGISLSGVTLSERSFSSSDLRGVDLSHTTLRNVSFGHADLTGANFTGATLENVFWGECICPDGTPSTAHGMRCETGATEVAASSAPAATTLDTRPITRAADGTLTREDFLLGTGRMFEKSKKTTYTYHRIEALTPEALHHIKEPRTRAALLAAKDRLVYDFVSGDGAHSFLLVVPDTERVHPDEATMYSY